MILEEVERHREAHLERLSEYRILEQQYLQNPQKTAFTKFQYLTLLRGISYEKIGWLGVTKLSNYLVEHSKATACVVIIAIQELQQLSC